MNQKMLTWHGLEALYGAEISELRGDSSWDGFIIPLGLNFIVAVGNKLANGKRTFANDLKKAYYQVDSSCEIADKYKIVESMGFEISLSEKEFIDVVRFVKDLDFIKSSKRSK